MPSPGPHELWLTTKQGQVCVDTSAIGLPTEEQTALGPRVLLHGRDKLTGAACVLAFQGTFARPKWTVNKTLLATRVLLGSAVAEDLISRGRRGLTDSELLGWTAEKIGMSSSEPPPAPAAPPPAPAPAPSAVPEAEELLRNADAFWERVDDPARVLPLPRAHRVGVIRNTVPPAQLPAFDQELARCAAGDAP